MRSAIIADVKRVVVVRAGGLGDAVFALRALRETYPSAELALATSEWLATLLDGRPGPVDRVVRLTAVPGVTVKPDEPGEAAAAVGTSTVGVYWIGNTITGGVLSRGRHRRAISWRLACPVCGVDCTKDVCTHEASFVADVQVSEVLGPALELGCRS